MQEFVKYCTHFISLLSQDIIYQISCVSIVYCEETSSFLSSSIGIWDIERLWELCVPGWGQISVIQYNLQNAGQSHFPLDVCVTACASVEVSSFTSETANEKLERIRSHFAIFVPARGYRVICFDTSWINIFFNVFLQINYIFVNLPKPLPNEMKCAGNVCHEKSIYE